MISEGLIYTCTHISKATAITSILAYPGYANLPEEMLHVTYSRPPPQARTGWLVGFAIPSSHKKESVWQFLSLLIPFREIIIIVEMREINSSNNEIIKLINNSIYNNMMMMMK